MTSSAASGVGDFPGIPRELVNLLVNPSLGDWVGDFFDPSGLFVGDTFDTLGDDQYDPNRFSVSDLLAITTLDVRVRPFAMRRLLFDDVEELRPMLAAITGECLWTASNDELEAAFKLFGRLKVYPWVGDTTASKLLARKRPGLLPVVDSVVMAALGTDDYCSTVQLLHSTLRQPALRTLVENVRPLDLDVHHVPTLRLLDSAIWISRSRGRSAKAVRGIN